MYRLYLTTSTASYTYLQNLWFPEDDCGLQPKHVGTIEPIVQLAGINLCV